MASDDRVRDWLCVHSRELEAVVEGLRACALLGGNRGVDVRLEALSALCGLVRVYRDARDARKPAVALEATRCVALMLELFAKSRFPRFVGFTLFALETSKAASRLAILADNAGRMLHDEQTRLEKSDVVRCACGVGALPAAARVAAVAGARSGRTILKGEKVEDLFEVAFERRRANSFRAVATPPADCEKCRARSTRAERPRTTPTLVVSATPPRPDHIAAELLHVARPVMQLVFLKLFGWRSWRAWGGSLAIDVVANAMMKRAENEAERGEVQRRRLNLLLYLVRSPMFDLVLRLLIRRVERVLRRIPLVGAPIGASIELLVMLQRFWFYTAGS